MVDFLREMTLTINTFVSEHVAQSRQHCVAVQSHHRQIQKQTVQHRKRYQTDQIIVNTRRDQTYQNHQTY